MVDDLIFSFMYLIVRLELMLDDLVDCEVEGLFREVLLLKEEEDDIVLLKYVYFLLESLNVLYRSDL